MKRYLQMPCVIVAADEPDQICVRYDNGAGIREGLNYMIEELGYTRIGMIGGPTPIMMQRREGEPTLRCLRLME